MTAILSFFLFVIFLCGILRYLVIQAHKKTEHLVCKHDYIRVKCDICYCKSIVLSEEDDIYRELLLKIKEKNNE